AEEDGLARGVVGWRGPDCAARGAVMEDVLAPGVLDRDWRIERFRLRADVVLPRDLAGFRLHGDEVAAAGAGAVRALVRVPLLERPAREHDFAVREDWRGEPAGGRGGGGERGGPRIDLPLLLACVPVECVEEAAEVSEIDRVLRHQGGAEDAGEVVRILRTAGTVEF